MDRRVKPGDDAAVRGYDRTLRHGDTQCAAMTLRVWL
jgi:hypothetical protein